MKRFVVLLLICAYSAPLIGCGEAGPPPAGEVGKGTGDAGPPTKGLAKQDRENMFKKMEEAGKKK